LLMTPWGEVEIQSSLIGDFNLSNLLAVIGVIGSFGMPADDMPQRIASISNVVGRMDQLPLAKGAVAIIDYAHTPNALENALQAARFHCSGKLWCVMGCGGDRDVGKRPIMGEITSRLADISVVTDDNPRTEASDEIIDNILAGVLSGADVRVEPDRRKAIAMALAGADEGDLILIAGKGHETYQEISGERFEFSDYVEVERHESGYVA
jgi:UDP-N-acetylmuramoyl-L-alanyl-D-glutamate--2,6-diaminopimelate ligase